MSRRDEVIDQVGGIMLSEGLKFRRDPDDDQFSMWFDSTLILIDVLGYSWEEIGELRDKGVL